MQFLKQKFINLEHLIDNNKIDLQNLSDVVKTATLDLIKEIENKEIALAKLFDNEEQLLLAEKIAKTISKFEQIVILAVGGSSLGGKTFSSLSELQNQHKTQKIIFVESIDPTTIKKNLENINYTKTAFLVISKSGETIETICQTLVAIDYFQKFNTNQRSNTGLNKEISDHFFFITENGNSKIGKIAKSINAPIYNHFAIGGRYSCFSAVGLLPALLCGLDANNIFKTARGLLESLKNNYQWLIESATKHLLLYNQGFSNIVLMPYLDNLKNFNDWYRQLVAESLGKNNFGFTPINSMGTVDQHSQLQLYLDGARDKLFSFIDNKKFDNDITIKGIEKNCNFHSCKLSSILQIEQNSTIKILSEKNLPIKITKIDQLNENSLSKLMIMTILEIITIAKVMKINPFDQPAVELRKVIANQMLTTNKI